MLVAPPSKNAQLRYRKSAKGKATLRACQQRYAESERGQLVLQERKAERERRRAWLNEYKLARGCVDCGYAGHPSALDFDHVRGEKVRNISEMLSYSEDRLMAEVAKCDVRCSNCHRVRTHDAKESKDAT